MKMQLKLNEDVSSVEFHFQEPEEFLSYQTYLAKFIREIVYHNPCLTTENIFDYTIHNKNNPQAPVDPYGISTTPNTRSAVSATHTIQEGSYPNPGE